MIVTRNDVARVERLAEREISVKSVSDIFHRHQRDDKLVTELVRIKGLIDQPQETWPSESADRRFDRDAMLAQYESLERELLEVRELSEESFLTVGSEAPHWLERETEDEIRRKELGVSAPSLLHELILRNPHLLMAGDFDEYRGILLIGKSFRAWSRWFQTMYGIETLLSVSEPIEQALFRESATGAWARFAGIYDPTSDEGIRPHLVFDSPENQTFIDVSEWIKKLQALVGTPDAVPRSLWMPSVWTPTIQNQKRIALEEAVKPIILELQRGQRLLRDVPWGELEDLVAELLRSRGMAVHVTPRRGDGGRDVIARGELIPGEPSLVAVEVKQTATVSLRDVQRALYANRAFPALLLVTAGRFSAGVLKEKNQDRNSLRLYLKDGVALSQWITAYSSVRASRDSRALWTT